MANERGERGVRLYSAWLLLVMAAPPCQEQNPDFDGPSASAGSATGSSTSSDVVTSTGSGTTADTSMPGTADGSSGAPPGTTTDPSTTSADATTTGEMGGSTTEGCTVCAGVCVDTQSDRDHCGQCNNKCNGQQQCIDGDCMVP